MAAQFDFTATPRHTKGQLFSWTVFDYPLKQAIIDNIVKRPLKGVAKGIAEQPSQMARIRYQAYLAAGVERWKEYRDQLAPLGRKPVLFVMMYDTAKADDVGDWLQKKYPTEFGGARLLVIHANRSGEVAVEDRAARLWCENATRLTDKPWSYLKVPQADYGRLQATRFADVAYLEEGERRGTNRTSRERERADFPQPLARARGWFGNDLFVLPALTNPPTMR